MRLIQFLIPNKGRRIGIVEKGSVFDLTSFIVIRSIVHKVMPGLVVGIYNMLTYTLNIFSFYFQK